jgi:similar to stage IV sporulation protein
VTGIFSGATRVNIEGMNIEWLLNQMFNKGILITNLHRISHKQIVFSTDYKSQKKLIALLKNSCYTLNIKKEFGAPYIFKFFKSRLGLLIGLILSVCLCLIYSFILWNINIIGNENISDLVILNEIKSTGVCTGILLNSIDTDKLENQIMNSISDIAMVNIGIKGTNLIVVIKEKIPKDTVNVNGNLVAEFDAVITKIVTIQGTQKVQVGEVVKKGEVLIEGSFTNTNGETESCKAIGTIMANVWYTGGTQFYEEKTVLARTGKYIDISYLMLLNSAMPIKRATNNFLFYEIENSTRYLFDKNILPFKIVKQRIYELEPVVVIESFEENKELLEYEALLKARENVPLGVETIKEYTVTNSGAGIYFIRGYIQVEIEIQKFIEE